MQRTLCIDLYRLTPRLWFLATTFVWWDKTDDNCLIYFSIHDIDEASLGLKHYFFTMLRRCRFKSYISVIESCCFWKQWRWDMRLILMFLIESCCFYICVIWLEDWVLCVIWSELYSIMLIVYWLCIFDHVIDYFNEIFTDSNWYIQSK